jgi:class 3 adenylate cyclase
MMHAGINIRKISQANRLVIGLIFLFSVLLLPVKVQSGPPLPDTIHSLWARYHKAGNDSARVVYLGGLAFYYHDYLGDEKRADSLAEAAIRVAVHSHHPHLIMLAYNNFLRSTDPDDAEYYKKAEEYASQAIRISRISGNLEMRWHTYISMAEVCLARYNFNKALLNSNEAIAIARVLKNDTLVAESYMSIGKSHGYKNQKIEAFRNFFTMKEIAEKIGDPGLLMKCYSELSGFYHDNNMFDDAMEYKRKEYALIQQTLPVDSVALMWAAYDLQLIEVRQMKTGLNEQQVKAIIDFAIRTRNQRLKSWEFALYRKHLLETDKIPQLYKFYRINYPDEFLKLRSTEREMYCRLKAYFCEYEQKPDSAAWYFNKTEQLLLNAPNRNNIYLANFYNRYGQFLIRQGRGREAIEKFSRSYNLCQANAYYRKFEFMLTASRHLEKLYSQVGDYKNAWFYAAMNLQISDTINTILKRDQLMDEEVKRERTLKEVAAEKDRQKIRQGRTQRDMMAGGVVFFIIVSLLVYRNFRNQKRLNRLLDQAKQQSDDLLLNILPIETAEELKSTGKASAKRFDEVTVMFTDFKDFTQASERMSAEELVDEINFYFSEFDKIISRHNIEKIKIIGDSYMCADGLPVANETHALDVVEAALELQEFMMSQKIERTGMGKSFFELRIGIHTGPVVAGIVGLKKFAYDIWGDTVNTASRMESSGETNRVNISGATYDRVKNSFTCTYRGKVTAKNKGQIDMYFVGAAKIPDAETGL